MTNTPPRESAEVARARQRWVDLSQQYVREVGLATDPLTTVEVRVNQLPLEKHAALVAEIQESRAAYYRALEAEGR